ncbi:HNH endonuclease [Rathayibacter sp. SD072]|uniref:HNH endonuclease n=1 Tax=Rathayibacter sp. SD072 TaxID=2781731 RepID=UPI001A966070|nr:HNH endonuclease [Rathayibacter sp. SD072]MBO0983837.1 HNH endonuclease [Rathayibacter sp. SD072]
MTVTDRARKILWTRAHNRCAFPTCNVELTSQARDDAGELRFNIVGEEAHIAAQKPGGPRFNPQLSAAEIDSYDNLILLCPTHHTMIDANDGSQYSVGDLRKMKASHEALRGRRADLEETIRAYVGNKFESENQINFQQVGLRGPTVDSMFVDVPVGARGDSSRTAELLREIARNGPGDTEELAEDSGLLIAGATQVLLHEDWEGNAVLIGGPGQGKSTLLQYLCQHHRARILGKELYGSRRQRAEPSSSHRIPIRLDLRKYAQWATMEGTGKPRNKSNSKESRWRSLEEYIAQDIARNVGGRKFSHENLATILATEPVLLALDGLDEVANLPLRDRVTREVSNASGRLSANAQDFVLLVATRPGGSIHPILQSTSFAVLHLQKLTPGLRLQYLDRWVAVAHLSNDAAERLRRAFLDNLNLPHINELASYPMQLAILLHLLDRRQLLPQQRTDLYREYMQTFLDREETEEKEPLLASHRRVIEDTHAFLGWHLQSRAEQGRSSGSISRQNLHTLLKSYLRDREEDYRIVEDIYNALTSRVLCLVERDDLFEFEVQSLREYFAAAHLADHLTARGVGNSRDDGLSELLQRPYWMNVCRFFVGMLSRGEVRSLVEMMVATSKRIEPLPHARVIAAQILNDRIYDGLPDSALLEVVELILGGTGVVLACDGALDAGGSLLVLGERAGRAQVVHHLKKRLEDAPEEMTRSACAALLRAHARESDQITEWWWSRFEPTDYWLAVGSMLGVFRVVDHKRVELLDRLALNLESSKSWFASQILKGGYTGSDPNVLALLHHDLNEGASGLLRMTLNKGATGILVRGASLAISSGSRLPSIALGREGAEWPPLEAVLQTINLSRSDDSAVSSVLDRAEAIAMAWGDGWVLDRAIAKVADSVDLASLAKRTGNAALDASLRRQQEVRVHRADVQWWRTYIAGAAGTDRHMNVVLQALQEARPSVFVAVAAEFMQLVESLSTKQFKAVERTLEIDAASFRFRKLSIEDDLRLRRVKLVGEAAWLCYVAGDEGTRKRLRPRLKEDLEQLLRGRTRNGVQVLAATSDKNRVKVDRLKGSRSTIMSGDIANGLVLVGFGARQARAILRDPCRWPADVSRVAIERLASDAAARVAPLAEVARAQKWFDYESEL